MKRINQLTLDKDSRPYYVPPFEREKISFVIHFVSCRILWFLVLILMDSQSAISAELSTFKERVFKWM
jgi:hypothetical protein